MEVSGKRAEQKLSASYTKASAESFDFYCEPCDGEGKHVEAHGYCKNCQEFLCKACLTSHRRVRLTKNHILLASDKMPNVQKPRQRDTDCSEKCLQHPKEIIIYYCKGHDEVGCHECMSANHSACVDEFIVYISDISSDTKDSVEYKNMLKEIDNLENETRNLERKATRNKEISDQSYTTAVKDIESFCQDIHDQFDKMLKGLLNDAGEEKEKAKSAMGDTSTYCDDVMLYTSRIKDKMKTPDVSQSNAFVLMKQNKKQLYRCKKTIHRYASAMTISTFKFQPNEGISDFLKTQKALGELTFSMEKKVETEDSRPTEVAARLLRRLNVKSNIDMSDCHIKDIDMLSSQELVLADFGNLSLKIFNIAEERVTDEIVLRTQPDGVTVLTKDKVAATTRIHILIICKSEKLKLVNEISIDTQCTGIRSLQRNLITVSDYPFPKIQVLSCEGNVLQTVLSDPKRKILENPQRIALSSDGKCVYVSDYRRNNTITRLSMSGEVVNVYSKKDKDDFMIQSRGIAVAGDGSLFVCDVTGNKIRKFSADLSNHKTILTVSNGIQRPQSIYLCKNSNRLFISNCESNEILVFSMGFR